MSVFSDILAGKGDQYLTDEGRSRIEQNRSYRDALNRANQVNYSLSERERSNTLEELKSAPKIYDTKVKVLIAVVVITVLILVIRKINESN